MKIAIVLFIVYAIGVIYEIVFFSKSQNVKKRSAFELARMNIGLAMTWPIFLPIFLAEIFIPQKNI